MEKKYNDELMPENFEEMAKAYSSSLKEKGFVFVKLQEEEFNFLIDEVLVLIIKMKACLQVLNSRFESQNLFLQLNSCEENLCRKFGKKKPHNLRCVADETNSFFTLIACQNLLIIKLMSLSSKSGEFELCNDAIISISSVFAKSFSCEGFLPEN